MTTKTFHSLEELHEKEPSLEYTFKGYGDTIKMWRESLKHLIYTHYDNRKDNYGQTYISPQNLGWMSYQLTPMPGCHAVLISHDSWLDKDKQGFGLGDYFHKERLKLAQDANISCMTCTVEEQNKVEKHILTKNGWTKVHTFHNKHTDHEVGLWVKNL